MLDIEALREELLAARTALEPEIRGIEALLLAAPEKVFADELTAQLALHTKRWNLITAVLRAIDLVFVTYAALKADGYPEKNIAPIGQPDFQAMATELADITAAVELFGHEASSGTISLNDPAKK